MLIQFELVDVWRKTFPNSRKYTWRKTLNLKQSRLDYIVSENMLRGKSINARIGPGIFSGHSFLSAEIDARKEVRGPGIWRFHNRLLSDESF